MRSRRVAIGAGVAGAAVLSVGLALLLSSHGPSRPPPTTTTTPPAPAPAAVRAGPLGAHSMLYSSAPYIFKQAMFSQAAALGVSEIRVDVDLSAIFPSAGQADWSSLDDYLRLARAYRLQVLANITATPAWLASCPPGAPPEASYRCGTDDAARYGALAGQVVAHSGGTIGDWEIVNEPDAPRSFLGSPAQYARMLSASYDAIHQADPQARVLIGGIGSGSSKAWLDRVFATPGANAIHKFDVANVHLRTPLAALAPGIHGWIEYFASKGFHGPLWVTEHGYPSDPAYQTDPSYRSGAQAQADYLTASIPALLRAGAAKVFVTERDNGSGGDASEGLLGGNVADPPSASPMPVRRPAFFAVQSLARKLAARQ